MSGTPNTSEITVTPNRQQLKQGDTFPAFLGYFEGVDLTDAEGLEIVLTGEKGGTIRGEAIATDSEGHWEYRWSAGDTDRPGDYLGELRVTRADGVQYLPQNDFLRLTILPRKGGIG